jgi:TorA maturation chaperone TorD
MANRVLPVVQAPELADPGCAARTCAPDALATVENWLSISARYRFASLLVELPTDAVLEEIRGVACELPEPLRAAAMDLASVGATEWEEAYHAVLGPGGCPACESSYDDAALGSRGPLIADVSGFYRAFAYAGRRDGQALPDHAAVELDFLSFLAMKAAFALHQNCDEEHEVTRGAFETFSALHPDFWLERFCDRLEAAEVPQYVAIAGWLRAAVIPPASVA